jgi:hypothetical protein
MQKGITQKMNEMRKSIWQQHGLDTNIENQMPQQIANAYIENRKVKAGMHDIIVNSGSTDTEVAKNSPLQPTDTCHIAGFLETASVD